MDQNIKQAIAKMLRHNVVRSDAWIARRIKGARPEMVRAVRLILERRGKLPHVSYYIDSNGRVWPRDFESVPHPQPAA
jgi:hypothetical protein